MAQLFSNNAKARLQSSITDVATSITLQTGQGALFPSPTGGDFFLATLYQYGTDGEQNHEIVKCTARSGDVLTVVRAQEGTTGRAFDATNPLELRVTRDTVNTLNNSSVTTASLTASTADINGGTIDGATIGGAAAAAGSFTTLTTSSTVTHNGGTANGVAYLNGSKVLTTGSALSFDGTNFSASNQIIAGIGVATANVIARSNVANGGAGYSQFLFGNANSDTRGYLSYTHASDALLFGIAGAEQMRLTSTGLGIGTSSVPNYAGYKTLAINGTSGGEIDFLDGGTTRGQIYSASTSLTVTTLGAIPLLLGTNGTTKATLDSSGNLGLGVTPSASSLATIQSQWGLLTGNQEINAAQNAYFNGGWKYVQTAVAAARYSQVIGTHQWHTAPSGTAGNAISFTQAMTLDASGNLGIGTSSPANKLTVAGNANITGNTTLGDASTDTVAVNGYMGVGGDGSTAAGVLISNSALTSANQKAVYVTATASSAASGSFNSFAAAPATAAASFTCNIVAGFVALDATKGAGSTITNQHGLYIADQTQGTNNYGITSAVSSGTNKWNIYASGTAANYFAGNVGIGTGSTAPTSPLQIQRSAADVYDGTSLASNTVGNSIFIDNQDNTVGSFGQIIFRNGASGQIWNRIVSVRVGSANGALAFITGTSTAAAERMRIDSAGNVGIGTSSPGAKLHVNGVVLSGLLDGTSDGNFAIGGNGGQKGGFGWDGANSVAVLAAFFNAPLVFKTGASAGTERLRIDSSGNTIQTQLAPAAVNTTATLTTANLRTRIITSTTAALVTGTLPTGTLMDSGLYNSAADMGYDWSVINTGGTNNFVVAAGTDHTVVGNMTVSPNTTGMFRSRRTTTNTWITYRVG